MCVDVSMKLVSFDIEIDTRVIIACLKNNNLFYFHIWKKRKSTMISFNFESSITMLMSKQYDIKFVVMNKISGIKLALLHIIFKNDIINKERFNSVDEFIFKFQYSDISFDSDSVFNFNSNSETSRKINIEIFNLWYTRINHLGY